MCSETTSSSSTDGVSPSRKGQKSTKNWLANFLIHTLVIRWLFIPKAAPLSSILFLLPDLIAKSLEPNFLNVLNRSKSNWTKSTLKATTWPFQDKWIQKCQRSFYSCQHESDFRKSTRSLSIWETFTGNMHTWFHKYTRLEPGSVKLTWLKRPSNKYPPSWLNAWMSWKPSIKNSKIFQSIRW